MSSEQEIISEQHEYEPAEVFPVESSPLEIAGFRRRVAAFCLDQLLLGIVLLIWVSIFQNFFYASGPDGRVYGFGLIVAYFTVFTSSVGQGQTIGKQALKIRVTDAQGGLLTVRRAFFRSSALFIIFLLNQWNLVVFITSPLLGIFAGTIVYGGLFSLIYNLVFNRTTRQGPHDWLVKSYVVRVPETEAVVYTVPARRPIHSSVTLGLFGVGVVISVGSFLFMGKNDLVHLAKVLNRGDRYFSVSLSHNITSNRLSIRAWYEKKVTLDVCVDMAREVAKTTFAEYKSIDDISALDVVIYRQMDLGFSFRAEICTLSASIERWRSEMAMLTYFNQGVEFLQSGNYTAAVESFTRAIDISPYTPRIYGNRGIAYSRLGEYDLALQDLYRYRELSPAEDLSPDILELITYLEKSTGKK